MKNVKLLDVVDLKNVSVKKFDGIKRYIATGDVDGNNIVSFTDVIYDIKPSRANIQVSENQVIFARMKGTNKVLKITIDNKDYIYSTGFCVLETKSNILPEYLNIVLKSSLFQKQKDKYSKGATQKAINNEGLKNILIPLSSIEGQKKIVQVLDKAQELIDARKQQIALLDDLIQSIFYDMFGDPVTNPKGWEIKKLGEVGSLQRGKSKHRPRNAPELLGGDYPLVQTGDIANAGYYLKSYTQTYSEIGLKQSKMWEKGTLCITIAANIARTAILDFDACFPDSIVAFLPSKYVNNMYIQLWFRFLQSVIEASAPESAQKNINLKILNNLDIPIPFIDLQNQFAKKVQKIEQQKELMKQSLTEMENNFNSLMQKAFKGELFTE